MKKIEGHVMYMGPRIGYLGLGYSKLFRNGVTSKQIIDSVALCPALGELFVPVAQIGPVLRELNFDYAHNMRGTTGKFVTFYREVTKWLASAKKQPPTTGATLHKHHA